MYKHFSFLASLSFSLRIFLISLEEFYDDNLTNDIKPVIELLFLTTFKSRFVKISKYKKIDFIGTNK